VASLSRPGGNLTGLNFFTNELAAKRLELLRELVPAARWIAVLVNPTYPSSESIMRDVTVAAGTMGLQIEPLSAATSNEINAVFAGFARNRPDALFVGGDPFFTTRRVQLVNLASRHALPASFVTREYSEIGALLEGRHAGGDCAGARAARTRVASAQLRANIFQILIDNSRSSFVRAARKRPAASRT
jgi:putative ABC transport system substrate-binding protein